MFDLHLDLKLYFCPPMDEHGEGIRLTQTIQVPFPPHNGLGIVGSTINDHPTSEGFALKDVVWDVDRNHFTAETSLINQGLPIGEIIDELACWTAIGWRLGSCADDLEEDAPMEDDISLRESTVPVEFDESFATKIPRQRSKLFNSLFQAVVRIMAEIDNATPTAYAMWKTKLFFNEEQLKNNPSKQAKRFRDAQSEFDQMSFKNQFDWQERVSRTCPQLDRVLHEYRIGRK